MKIGRLRHKIEIQSPADTLDEFGSSTRSWTTEAVRWAAVEPYTGRELFLAKQTQADVTTKITLRSYPLKPQQRIKFGNRTFQILYVVNTEERGFETVAQCKEAV